VTYLTTIAHRITSDGGTVVLGIQPMPSPALQPPGEPSWDDYRAAVLALGNQLHCQVIDQSHLWGSDYSVGEAAGKYADPIHPSDAGARDIADSIWDALTR